MSLNFEELLDKNLSTVTMKPGSLLTGIVIDILETHVIVHVGLKSEAVVAIQEFAIDIWDSGNVHIIEKSALKESALSKS